MRDAEVFRSRENTTVAAVWTTLVILWGAIGVVLADAYAPIALVLVAGGVLVGLWAVRRWQRSRLELDDSGLPIINPFSVHRLRWDEVRSCQGGRVLTITTDNGRKIRAWAVQNSNWSDLKGGTGYADEVASAVLERVRTRRPPRGS